MKQEKRLLGVKRKSYEVQEDFDLLQVNNYIFVDDMIGTGETMEKFLIKFMDHFPKTKLRSIEDVHIYLFVLEACEHGVDRLISFCEKNGMKAVGGKRYFLVTSITSRIRSRRKTRR
ncbi:hypothetical protein EJP82_12615 [Paenibacillus anaericanus]|uniref:PRTase-CE domain-containing protein n=1 Tax=Paenibacillus anaericanus TaxID=170367 RepID=A0A3S1C930_9BACL|nr:hypothetical protein [Paenibacillus anaericanus]RUT46312.1 hypothetical protein EJP82_12615 [Paenibacillus anaericanus]